jgi:hypothetical protein
MSSSMIYGTEIGESQSHTEGCTLQKERVQATHARSSRCRSLASLQ